MKAPIIAFFCVLVYSYSQSQELKTLYYSSQWEITPKDQATYFRVCNYNPTGLFFVGEVKDYTLDSTLLMKGFYSRYGTKEGEFHFYYLSGELEAQGNFKNNIRSGIWKYYHKNGNLHREVLFSKDTFSPLTVGHADGNKTIENGTGRWYYEYEWYNQKDSYIIEGGFINGQKEGEWICKLSSGKILYREIYKEGILIKGISYIDVKKAYKKPIDNKIMLPFKFEISEEFISTIGTESRQYPRLSFLSGQDSVQNQELFQNDTTIKDVFTWVDEPAHFPGGDEALKKFIALNINYPAEAKRTGQSGKVFIKFIIEKDGSITILDILKGDYRLLNLEAIRLVSSFPNWIPAKKNGQIVRSQHVLPISFKFGS